MRKYLLLAFCLFAFLEKVFSSESNLDSLIQLPFQKIVVISSKKEPLTAQKIQISKGYVEIVNTDEKLIVCKSNDLEEISFLLPSSSDKFKSEDIQRVIDTFPKSGSKLASDPRFSSEILAQWQLLLQEATQSEKDKNEEQIETQKRAIQTKAVVENNSRTQQIEALNKELPEKLKKFISNWKGNPDTLSFYNPDTDPEAAKSDHEESVRRYLSIQNRASCPGNLIAGRIAFKILAYLKIRYPEKWAEMIVDNNTPWKHSVTMREVLENFYAMDEVLDKQKAEGQADLEERKRKATEF